MITTNQNIDQTTSTPSSDSSESLDLGSAMADFTKGLETQGENNDTNTESEGSPESGTGIDKGIETNSGEPTEQTTEPTTSPVDQSNNKHDSGNEKPTQPTIKPTGKPTEASSVQEPVNLPKRDRSGFKHLKSIAEKWELSHRKEIEEKASLMAELQDLRQKVSNPLPVPEEISKELETLRFHKALYDVENSEQFKKQYDEKILINDNHIYAILEQGNFDKSEIEAVKKGGGISNFKVGENFGEDKGKRLIDTSYWNEEVLPKMSPSQRKLVEGLLSQNEIVSLQKRQALEKAPELRKEYLNNVEKIQQEQKQQINIQLQSVVRQMEEQNPWAKIVEILPTDTPQIKAQKEAQNKYRKEVIEPIFDEAFALTREDAPPEARAQVAGLVVQCDYLGGMNRSLYETVQNQQKEIAKLRTVKEQIKSAQTMKPSHTIQDQKEAVNGDSYIGLTEAQETGALLRDFVANRQ